MRKILILLVTFLFCIQNIFASSIDVLPTMQSKSNIEDRVWVGTFQIVWNDLIDWVTFNEIKFPEGTPDSAIELNKREFSAENLSEKSYYKYVGKITKSTKKTITKAIKRKFNETSDILDKLNLNPKQNGFIVYAMLKKDFEFLNSFDKFGKLKFRGNDAEFFGINNNSDEKLRNGIRVMFYNSSNDCAVILSTKDNDELYLYKTNNTKSFASIYSDMKKKEKLYKGSKNFNSKDELKIPEIRFFEEKEFTEFEGKRIKGTQLTIDKALETIKFEMDNRGVKLKSEAAITVLKSALPPKTEKPRLFYFDDTFVIFLKEKDKSKPYFALRVHNISNFLGKE